MTRIARLAVTCAAVALAASLACRGRGAGRHDCPPPPVPDGAPSLRGPSAIVGGADEAWAAGGRPVDEAYTRAVLLHWDGCSWYATPSPLDGVDLNEISALSARGDDLWLAAADRGISEGMEVFGPDGSIARQGGGLPYCHGDGRVFRRRGDAWEEARPLTTDAGPPIPTGAAPRVQWALAAAGPGEIWMLDASCGVGSVDRGVEGDVRLVRWDGRALTTVEIDRGIGKPTRILFVEGRAWPWSETMRLLWVAGTKGAGRWDGRSWSWFPFVEPDVAYQLAGSGPSDVWAFGLGARHWDGERWSMVRGPATRDPTRTAGPVFLWAGAVPEGHTFALDSTGTVFRTSGARLTTIGRVLGQFWGLAGLAVGTDELWLWAPGSAQPPILRWRAGSWEVSPAARSSGVSLE